MSFNALDFDLFKDFPEPVFVMAPDGTILAANRFFTSRFESLHERIIGCNVFELLTEINAPPEIIANRKNKTGEALRFGKHVVFDDPMDGDFWRNSIYPVFDDDGKIQKLLVFGQNVTKQKLAEMESEELRAKMDYALESSHVSVWTHDIDNNLLMRTLEHDRIFGYDSLLPEWRIERFFSHIYSEDLPMVTRLFETLMVNRSDFNIEFRIRRTDGEIRWINLVGTFRFTKPGASRFIVGIILDITEKKLAALELEQLQAQLQQAQKMELVGQLAGGIAHDFNNSLTAIMGNIDLALAKIDPSQPVAENLRDAHKSAHHSAHLIRQLLGFARKQMVLPKALCLNQEIENLIPMLKIVIGTQIECVWLPGENVPTIFIDPFQLDQVLSNLCINARDATEPVGTITISTGTVHIEMEECAKGQPCRSPGDYAVLSVNDTGSGINSTALPHIFEPFFTTKPIGKGSGLGLSTVYGIVKQNNGYIDCQTEPGKGTVFSLFFPQHRRNSAKSRPDSPGQPPESAAKTVLLVEDEPDILNMLKLALEENGHRVLDALDAESALLLAEQHKEKIDLLATDIILPIMNGIELSKQLQARLPELKSLFMSGFAFKAYGSSGQASNSVNFIRKPFTIPDFMNLVHQVLQEQ
jgi:two-component system, cell cycle sensor histidine kinase and response regulator CckA